MNSIIELFEIDFVSIFISVSVILIGIKTISELLEWFVNKLGLETKGSRKRREEHQLLITTAQNIHALQQKHEEDVKQSIRHDELIKDDLSVVSSKMDALSEQITNMQSRIDETEMAKLKDKLLSYYNKYKKIGEWSRMESEAFWDLYGRYIVHGGNSFVHETVEPIMRELKIVD